MAAGYYTMNLLLDRVIICQWTMTKNHPHLISFNFLRIYKYNSKTLDKRLIKKKRSKSFLRFTSFNPVYSPVCLFTNVFKNS
jgi:hypothetical protein